LAAKEGHWKSGFVGARGFLQTSVCSRPDLERPGSGCATPDPARRAGFASCGGGGSLWSRNQDRRRKGTPRQFPAGQTVTDDLTTLLLLLIQKACGWFDREAKRRDGNKAIAMIKIGGTSYSTLIASPAKE
jgi:hypothetical protein